MPTGADDRPVALEALELRRIRLRLQHPFVAAHGAEHERDILLVRALGPGVEGWGECVALAEPTYSPEHVDGATEVVRRFLAPALLAGGPVRAREVAARLGGVAGNPMAKAAVEMAVLDAELRQAGVALAPYLGATRTEVDSGVAVGLAPDLGALLDDVAQRVAEGYRRVKLKVQPGGDVAPVRAVREAFPNLALQVDANGSYTLGDAPALAALDAFDLLLLEQPLAADDLLGHAELARLVTTPICLDESLTSTGLAAAALALGACSVVNVKPGRLGGLLEAKRLHDLCAASGVPAWVGAMLETGIGRAANVALAALPGCTLPGDLSASDRYWEEDLTEPFVLHDGRLAVPAGPGLGVTPRPEVLARVTTWVEVVRA